MVINLARILIGELVRVLALDSLADFKMFLIVKVSDILKILIAVAHEVNQYLFI